MPLPGADDLLDYLQSSGMRVALVTSAVSNLVTPLLHRLSWLDRFHAVVCGDMIARAKPEPHIYLRGLELLAVTAQHSCAVEDSPNGVRAAVSAGLQVCGVNSDATAAAALRQAGAEEVFTGLEPVKSWLTQLSAASAT